MIGAIIMPDWATTKATEQLLETWYQRVTFTLNADYKVKDWLTSNSTFSFADATWYGLPASQEAEANYFSRTLSLPPTFRGLQCSR